MPKFARITKPSSILLLETQKNDRRSLEEDALLTLDTLKDKLISPPVLSLPKHNGNYTLEADRCDKQVECVFLQHQDDGKIHRPIGHWSQTLTKQERTLYTTNRECLAVVCAIL